MSRVSNGSAGGWPRVAYVLPTRDRPAVLAQTLAALGSLPAHDAQVVVVDNASTSRPALPRVLGNGLDVTLVPLRSNAGAAARNAGAMAADPSCGWIVMLDDDSAPLDLGHLRAIAAAAAESSVAAVAAEIWLKREEGIAAARHPGIQRESGGLPEVFTGCGVAIRRDAFLEAGGYDHAFGYYAEEYDLAARFLLAGMRVTLDRRFQVLHRKVAAGRDMNLILHRLVRNNGWVMQRYAPARRRVGALAHTIDRYGRIAENEAAVEGYRRGLAELAGTLASQPRRPMTAALWARFTGAAAARASLERAWTRRGFRTAALIDEGKNAGVVRAVLRELGVRETAPELAEALVIGTLSPGPLLDSWDRRGGGGGGSGGVGVGPRIVSPWDELVGEAAAAAAA